jgi:hypothetical protein
MMIALPNIDGSFTCTLFLANEGNLFKIAIFEIMIKTGPYPSFATLDSEAKVEIFFKEQFPDVYLSFAYFHKTYLMTNLVICLCLLYYMISFPIQLAPWLL